jgi:hypothetical protein
MTGHRGAKPNYLLFTGFLCRLVNSAGNGSTDYSPIALILRLTRISERLPNGASRAIY